MATTNFDRYLEEQMRDPAFTARFAEAGKAWDVALQVAELRRMVFEPVVEGGVEYEGKK